MKIDELKCFVNYTYQDREIKINFDLHKKYCNENIQIEYSFEKLIFGNRIQVILEAKKDISTGNFELLIPYYFHQMDYIYLNGYQSWTQSKEYRVNERMNSLNRYFHPITKNYGVKNFGDSSFYKYSDKKGEYHGYTYTYIKNQNQTFFIGSLNEKKGFTIFQYQTSNNKLFVIKDIQDKMGMGDKIEIDLLITKGTEKEVFKSYFSLLGCQNQERNVSGWTSWYNYYTDINEKIILENLSHFSEKKIPIDYFQIDDGYQKSVGDWCQIKKTFPNGMRSISEKIRESGFHPGIWIAPFICQSRSSIFHDYQNWVIKDNSGKPFLLGYSKGYWNDSFYALDFYNADFREYIADVLRCFTVEWNFDLIKMDFWYALTFVKKEKKSRAEVYFEAVDFIKKCIHKKKILGCGVPLAAGFKKFDYCRIGSDVAPYWDDFITGKIIRYRERVSSYNSLMSTIGRNHLNGNVFLNDPDVFILRKDKNLMKNTQKYTLFLLNNLFGGLIFTSDNINLYDKKEMDLYGSQFPLVNKNIEMHEWVGKILSVHFWIGKIEYYVYSNFSVRKNKVSREGNFYFQNKIIKNSFFYTLKPFESICLVKIQNCNFEIMGGKNHLFPGSEVKMIETGPDQSIELTFHEKGYHSSSLYISIPENWDWAMINGKRLKAIQWCGYRVVHYKN